MKKNKGNESSSTKPTDLSDNVLKYQNTMLATHIDILKRELAKAEANTQSFLVFRCTKSLHSYLANYG